MLIVGAGLAGLIAAHAWPNAPVIEAALGPSPGHAALLRFRSDAVARLTGIEFHAVRVNKGIWLDGEFIAPNIRAANMYSSKVLADGRLEDRSIWNVDPVTRYVAPENLYDSLVEAVGTRISWGAQFDWTSWLQQPKEPLVNTAPLGSVAGALFNSVPKFERAPITVERFRVRAANVYQTIYFPTAEHSVYRASITKDLLIIEHAGEPRGDGTNDVLAAFGLLDVTPLGRVVQRYGKITPIDESARRHLLVRLTQEHGIYSLGRFATWRNILLDDVVDDIAVIKRLIRMDDAAGYVTRIAHA